MTPKDALLAALRTADSQAAFARRLKVSPQAITEWLRLGRAPSHRVIDIATAASFTVTPHQLRPDRYPHPDDGMPKPLTLPGIESEPEALLARTGT